MKCDDGIQLVRVCVRVFAHHRCAILCGDQPVRSIREEGESGLDGQFKLDCARDILWSTDPMPYGIKVAHGTYMNAASALGNVTLALKGHCDGLDRCRVPAVLLGLRDARWLDVAFRCGGELASRTILIEKPGPDDLVHLDCANPAKSDPTGLDIHSAVLRNHCLQPVRNAKYAAKNLCDGAARCDFQSVYRMLGPPPAGCQEELDVVYSCTGRSGPPAAATVSASRPEAVVVCGSSP
jgi:hypothetical protein